MKQTHIAMLILACASLALAEHKQPSQNTASTVELPPLVVTGITYPSHPSGITATVNLIEQEQLRLSQANYVGDLLKFCPSVSVRNEGLLGRQGIAIRGLGSNCRRIQILVDGRPEKMSLFGCSVTQTLPLTNIQRIELARGPESVLYGADAMGGVINVITKKRETDGHEGSWTSSYGSHAQIHNQLSYGFKDGPLDAYLTYASQQANGFRKNSDYESDFGSLRLGYQLDEVWKAELTSQFFKDFFENPGPDYNPSRNHDWQKYRRWFWNASLKAEWEQSELTLKAFQNYGYHHFNMPTYQDFWQSKDYTFGLGIQYLHKLIRQEDIKDLITIGYDYERQWAKPLDDYTETITAARKFYDFGPYRTQSHQLYAFNELTLGNWVNSTGLRIHWDDLRHHLEWIPQTAVLYHLTQQTDLKAKVSKGFRLPRFSETFLFPAHNEDLDPEEVWNYELGIAHHILPKRARIEATAFYMDVRDQVRTIRRPGQKPAKFNINAKPYSIHGLELEFSDKPTDNLQLNLNYTLTHVEDDDYLENANRDGIPEQMIAASLTYKWDKLSASFQCKHVHKLFSSNQIDSERIAKLDDFLVANLSLAYDLNDHTTIFAGIDNLFDTDYQEYNGYDAPGITLYAGLQLKF